MASINDSVDGQHDQGPESTLLGKRAREIDAVEFERELNNITL
jgi:hypothetical protein